MVLFGRRRRYEVRTGLIWSSIVLEPSHRQEPRLYYRLNRFQIGLSLNWFGQNHIHCVVYRKWFPKHIRDVYTAALNRIETALKPV